MHDVACIALPRRAYDRAHAGERGHDSEHPLRQLALADTASVPGHGRILRLLHTPLCSLVMREVLCI